MLHKELIFILTHDPSSLMGNIIISLPLPLALSLYLPPFPRYSCIDSHPLSVLSSFTSLSFLPLLHRHLSQSRYIIPLLHLFVSSVFLSHPFRLSILSCPLVEASVHLGLCNSDRNSLFIFFLRL